MALQVFRVGLVVALIIWSGQSTVYGNEEDGEEQADAAYVQPSFISKAGDHMVLSGSSATLPCRVADVSGGEYAVEWYKITPGREEQSNNDPSNEGESLFVERQRMSQDERLSIAETGDENDFSLHITDVTAFDSGPYECRISTTPILVQRQYLTVKVPPSVNVVPDDSPYVIEPGHTMALNCDGAGYPPPDVTWSRVGNTLPDGRASFKGNPKAQLFYENVNVSHKGIYRCIADNNVGDPAFAEITVDVVSKEEPTDPPSAQTDRKFMAVRKGDDVTLTCNYSGNPEPQVHWMHESYKINPHSQNKKGRVSIGFRDISGNIVLTETTLKITSIDESEFGEYTCRMSNNLGTSEQNIDVSGKPGPPYPLDAEVYNDRIDLRWNLESAADLLGYKLFYKKENDDFSLSVDIPASHGRRVKGNEWAANYSWRLDTASKALLKPNTEYKIGIQGVNEYGDGSLPKNLLIVKTPEKFEGDTDHKQKGDGTVKDFEERRETSKSTKANGNNGVASLRPTRMAMLSVFAIPLIVFRLRSMA